MNDFSNLTFSSDVEYRCSVALDLYDQADCKTLATQANQGRYLILSAIASEQTAIQVTLVEDGYQAWLPFDQLNTLIPASEKYEARIIDRAEIESQISNIIAYLQSAKKQSNYYLWGGNLGPNYDCSGLIQAAFVASGIWLPRDSYQQEAFTERIAIADLLLGDLVFFGNKKVDHVALNLGNGYYIHSSGQEMGRNGIGIDILSADGDEISRSYYQKWWSCGRVMSSYQPH